MPSSRIPLSFRAAHLLADVMARAVSLWRPISTYIEEVEDEAGELVEVEGRNVVVLPVIGMPWWRLDIWRDTDADPEGCLHAAFLGYRIEVYYLRDAKPQPAA